jgi:hypothetical protein
MSQVSLYQRPDGQLNFAPSNPTLSAGLMASAGRASKARSKHVILGVDFKSKEARMLKLNDPKAYQAKLVSYRIGQELLQDKPDAAKVRALIKQLPRTADGKAKPLELPYPSGDSAATKVLRMVEGAEKLARKDVTIHLSGWLANRGIADDALRAVSKEEIGLSAGRQYIDKLAKSKNFEVEIAALKGALAEGYDPTFRTIPPTLLNVLSDYDSDGFGKWSHDERQAALHGLLLGMFRVLAMPKLGSLAQPLMHAQKQLTDATGERPSKKLSDHINNHSRSPIAQPTQPSVAASSWSPVDPTLQGLQLFVLKDPVNGRLDKTPGTGPSSHELAMADELARRNPRPSVVESLVRKLPKQSGGTGRQLTVKLPKDDTAAAVRYSRMRANINNLAYGHDISISLDTVDAKFRPATAGEARDIHAESAAQKAGAAYAAMMAKGRNPGHRERVKKEIESIGNSAALPDFFIGEYLTRYLDRMGFRCDGLDDATKRIVMRGLLTGILTHIEAHNNRHTIHWKQSVEGALQALANGGNGTISRYAAPSLNALKLAAQGLNLSSLAVAVSDESASELGQPNPAYSEKSDSWSHSEISGSWVESDSPDDDVSHYDSAQESGASDLDDVPAKGGDDVLQNLRNSQARQAGGMAAQAILASPTNAIFFTALNNEHFAKADKGVLDSRVTHYFNAAGGNAWTGLQSVEERFAFLIGVLVALRPASSNANQRILRQAQSRLTKAWLAAKPVPARPAPAKPVAQATAKADPPALSPDLQRRLQEMGWRHRGEKAATKGKVLQDALIRELETAQHLATGKISEDLEHLLAELEIDWPSLSDVQKVACLRAFLVGYGASRIGRREHDLAVIDAARAQFDTGGPANVPVLPATAARLIGKTSDTPIKHTPEELQRWKEMGQQAAMAYRVEPEAMKVFQSLLNSGELYKASDQSIPRALNDMIFQFVGFNWSQLENSPDLQTTFLAEFLWHVGISNAAAAEFSEKAKAALKPVQKLAKGYMLEADHRARTVGINPG